MQYTRYQQYVILYVLERIKEADFIIDPREVEYFDKMLLEFNLGIEEIEALESLDLDKCRECIAQMIPDQQKDVQRMFVTMAGIDQFVDPREEHVIDLVMGV